MSSGFRDLLGPARRAPKGAHRQGLKTKAMITHAARAVVRECLKDARGGFTAKEIFVQVPVFAASYTDANALGTALGEGVRGRGLGLHRDRDDSFLRCRENATLAAEHLEDAEIDDLTAELGFRAPTVSPKPSINSRPPRPGRRPSPTTRRSSTPPSWSCRDPSPTGGRRATISWIRCATTKTSPGDTQGRRHWVMPESLLAPVDRRAPPRPGRSRPGGHESPHGKPTLLTQFSPRRCCL